LFAAGSAGRGKTPQAENILKPIDIAVYFHLFFVIAEAVPKPKSNLRFDGTASAVKIVWGVIL
jgi:hypothetical protein